MHVFIVIFLPQKPISFHEGINCFFFGLCLLVKIPLNPFVPIFVFLYGRDDMFLLFQRPFLFSLSFRSATVSTRDAWVNSWTRFVSWLFFSPPPPPYPSFFVCFKTKKPKRKREREKWANKTLEDDKNFGGMQVRNWGVAKDLWVGNSRRKHTVRRIFLFFNFLFFWVVGILMTCRVCCPSNVTWNKNKRERQANMKSLEGIKNRDDGFR